MHTGLKRVSSCCFTASWKSWFKIFACCQNETFEVGWGSASVLHSPIRRIRATRVGVVTARNNAEGWGDMSVRLTSAVSFCLSLWQLSRWRLNFSLWQQEHPSLSDLKLHNASLDCLFYIPQFRKKNNNNNKTVCCHKRSPSQPRCNQEANVRIPEWLKCPQSHEQT